jgi:transcription initiation factor TFIIIB Brf1 subunit/transcription initiation factor TFIIB
MTHNKHKEIIYNKYLDDDYEIDNFLSTIKINTDLNVCINCKSSNIITEGSTKTCNECGVINEERLNNNVDITNNDEADTSHKYGGPSNNQFTNGTKIASKGFNRISLIQNQGQIKYTDLALLKENELIKNTCKKYNINQKCIETAQIYYKMIYTKKHDKGKREGKNIIMRRVNKLLVQAGCLFNACKIQGEPRTVQEIADIFNIEIKHVNRGCRKFSELININTMYYQFKSSKSVDFIQRFSENLNIDKKYIDIAKDISRNIHKLDLAATHEPPSIAAGCILLVVNIYNIQLSKKQISDIFGISDVTISKTYRKIYPFHKILVSNKITDLIIEKKNAIVNKENNLITTETEESSVYSEVIETTETTEETEVVSIIKKQRKPRVSKKNKEIEINNVKT